MPGAVVLDVNETLFSLDALDPVFAAVDLAEQRDLWFARTLRNGFALTSSGEYRSFPEIARAAFLSLAPDRLIDADAQALMDAFGQLSPHPEVPGALARLRDAGASVMTLSVGSAQNVERLFERAGMADLVSRHLSCEEVRTWKPAPAPYLHACGVLGTDPADTWMVAAHAWDLAGARAVGMRTAWLARLESVFDPNFGVPELTGADLQDVVDRLLSR